MPSKKGSGPENYKGKLRRELELQKAGKYFVELCSHNGNELVTLYICIYLSLLNKYFLIII